MQNATLAFFLRQWRPDYEVINEALNHTLMRISIFIECDFMHGC